MRLLLDTHALLWWLSDDTKLGAEARSAIADGSNEILVSTVSLAEIAIKRSLGKLHAPASILEVSIDEGFAELPLLSTHAAALARLPWHHRDPFDRLLLAQAEVEDLVVVTADRRFADYSARLLRA